MGITTTRCFRCNKSIDKKDVDKYAKFNNKHHQLINYVYIEFPGAPKDLVLCDKNVDGFGSEYICIECLNWYVVNNKIRRDFSQSNCLICNTYLKDIDSFIKYPIAYPRFDLVLTPDLKFYNYICKDRNNYNAFYIDKIYCCPEHFVDDYLNRLDIGRIIYVKDLLKLIESYLPLPVKLTAKCTFCQAPIKDITNAKPIYRDDSLKNIVGLVCNIIHVDDYIKLYIMPRVKDDYIFVCDISLHRNVF